MRKRLEGVALLLAGLALLTLGLHHILGSELRCDRSTGLCTHRRGLLGSSRYPVRSLAQPRAHRKSGKNDRNSLELKLDNVTRELDTFTHDEARESARKVEAFLAGKTDRLRIAAARSKFLIGSSLVFGLLSILAGVGLVRRG